MEGNQETDTSFAAPAVDEYFGENPEDSEGEVNGEQQELIAAADNVLRLGQPKKWTVQVEVTVKGEDGLKRPQKIVAGFAEHVPGGAVHELCSRMLMCQYTTAKFLAIVGMPDPNDIQELLPLIEDGSGRAIENGTGEGETSEPDETA
ncbi:MAG: hypothetical protein GTN64_05590 [Candidatus Latescibacteria bacterium]|nr:hypothetical protein [Candidatus Latescibacterota bacterium]NIO78082.1 hypothetical protein [Candidatus Latescibacterota bacterium]